MRDIDKIILHCTGSICTINVQPQSIDLYHRSIGYDCIGYHFVITLNGDIYTGRPIEQDGAHCYGQNKNSIGIVYVGGLTEDAQFENTMNEEQTKSMIDLLHYLKQLYPNATIHGHNEFANKACPCFNVNEWLKDNNIEYLQNTDIA